MYDIKLGEELVTEDKRADGFKGVVTPETKYVDGKVNYTEQFSKIFKYSQAVLKKTAEEWN